MRMQFRNAKTLKRRSLVVFAAFFAVAGAISLVRSFAAISPNAKVAEAESYASAQNATTVADSSASGSSYMQFDTVPTGGGTLKNCAAVPSQCGYPDGTNTGPAPGTTFTRVPQDITSGTGWAWESNFGRLRVTGNGAVLNGLNISGPVVIDAANVTLSNSIVTYCNTEGDIIALRAGNTANGYNGNFATIRNNRLTCDQPFTNRARSGVRDIYGAAQGAQIIANDISGAGNGITLEFDGVAKDNWIHDLGHLAGDHHSGVSTHGGAQSIMYEHNTLLLANTSTTGGGGLSGAITAYGDFAHAQNLTAKNNFVSGGAYTVYGGINNEDIYGQPTNIVFMNNRFVCNSWIYGPAFLRSGPTNVFSGNYCDQDLSTVNP